MFEYQEDNGHGIFVVNFTKNGQKVKIYVDDWFPSLHDKPAFANTKDGAIWVMILEKAWAKLHGSFSKIISGEVPYALRDLTGAPS